ncbi:ABC transporter permease [Paracidovorax valerianellae]|uniref:Peptide/nickel transport system permease protein n=1 Tax=Paracidovorax valerianellae TaxID=187868 RepID=A0A1G6PXM4_9BURK|nr:ABC transporter permease [Paracidovorax valerianellae]MDA8444527.1 ABC transporter permease [Paracidovorax valerianellae]SDC84952.1 peptide/nickel transport system permease protein [Paracidovorax valerianellae]
MTQPVTASSTAPAARGFDDRSIWYRVAADFLRSRTAAAALAVLALVVIAALAAPWITPQNPYDLMQLDVLDARLKPGATNGEGTFTYWLGTDGQGRDLYSAIVYGLRISLLVGVGSAVVAAVIGTLVGLLAAYAGGKVDALLMRVVDLLLSFPTILMALMILAYVGKGVGNVVLTLVLLEWAYYARTARGQALVEARREYVEAARGQGIPGWRIVTGHILPNCLPPLLVIGALQVARAITLEATLSFLGLGVPITEPSLGLLISNGYQYLLSNEYWISFFPGLALLFTIVAINLVGDQLRDVLNPRLQK